MYSKPWNRSIDLFRKGRGNAYFHAVPEVAHGWEEGVIQDIVKFSGMNMSSGMPVSP